MNGRIEAPAVGMLAYMKRTTVKIPDELDLRLRLEAKRRGLTISELTREAIETHLGDRRPRRLVAAGSGRSGRADVSERIEEILREEWGR
jgi:Ribbon-helix-helix protein, copG family